MFARVPLLPVAGNEFDFADGILLAPLPTVDDFEPLPIGALRRVKSPTSSSPRGRTLADGRDGWTRG